MLYAIITLSLMGIILSSYLLYIHYDVRSQPICPVEGCDKVLESEYAEILGIPVALVGLVGFVLVFALSLFRLVYPTNGTEKIADFIFLVSIMGTAFGIYLTYLELFVIHAICIYCALCFILMIFILILAAIFSFEVRREPQSSTVSDESAE